MKAAHFSRLKKMNGPVEEACYFQDDGNVLINCQEKQLEPQCAQRGKLALKRSLEVIAFVFADVRAGRTSLAPLRFLLRDDRLLPADCTDKNLHECWR